MQLKIYSKVFVEKILSNSCTTMYVFRKFWLAERELDTLRILIFLFFVKNTCICVRA